MTQGQAQALLTALSGVVFAASVYGLAHRGRITFRYTVGWLALFGVGVLGGVAVPVIGPVANALKVTPAALVCAIAAFIVLSICIQFSISISGMQEQIRRLTEDLAQLEMKHRESHVDSE